ncbi:MAG: glycosyltransferase family 4 protein [Nanoarchaeota archaeon]|nr:glycosyltransferase family 4 protein [Nanoarchaeota archaeon]
MNQLIFFGTDLHNSPTELASKTVKILVPHYKNSIVLSIQNRKQKTRDQNIYIIPRFMPFKVIRKLFQAVILPFYFLFFRLKGYNKIAIFWTVGNFYHSILFKYLKVIKFKIFLTVISSYDQNYSSLKYCDKIICQSEKMKTFLRKKFKIKQIVVIYPGVNLDLFKPKKKQNKLVVISVPYLVKDFPKRGANKLINFLQKNQNIKTSIITRSDESAEFIERKIGKKKTINGALSDKELSLIISTAKVMPIFYKESPDMPLSAIEGLASGCAIICSDNSGLSHIIKKSKSGLVCDKLTLNSINKIFNNPRYNQNARLIAEELFNVKRMIREYNQIIR